MAVVTDRQIEGAGTSEAEWQASGAWQNVPVVNAADLVPPSHRVVVCAPHPDDEILPCAGLLSLLAEREIVILAATDGEASHLGRADELRAVRPVETRDALQRLGVEASVIRFGLPDGGLTGRENELTDRLARHFTWRDIVFSPWQMDGHPDHEALTAAARKAAKHRGCAPPVEMPVWGWHWARPEDDAMPWARAARVELSPEILAAKRRAIRAFVSQTEEAFPDGPILTPATLARFERPFEIFFR